MDSRVDLLFKFNERPVLLTEMRKMYKDDSILETALLQKYQQLRLFSLLKKISPVYGKIHYLTYPLGFVSDLNRLYFTKYDQKIEEDNFYYPLPESFGYKKVYE